MNLGAQEEQTAERNRKLPRIRFPRFLAYFNLLRNKVPVADKQRQQLTNVYAKKKKGDEQRNRRKSQRSCSNGQAAGIFSSARVLAVPAFFFRTFRRTLTERSTSPTLPSEGSPRGHKPRLVNQAAVIRRQRARPRIPPPPIRKEQDERKAPKPSQIPAGTKTRGVGGVFMWVAAMLFPKRHCRKRCRDPATLFLFRPRCVVRKTTHVANTLNSPTSGRQPLPPLRRHSFVLIFSSFTQFSRT